jgi:hypothetical protein
MAKKGAVKRKGTRMPPYVRELFWEYGPRQVSWRRDRGFVIKRILSHGEERALRWLRRNTTDDELRQWFRETKGRDLDPPKLRFWELALGLPKKDVDRWVRVLRKGPWRERVRYWPGNPK